MPTFSRHALAAFDIMKSAQITQDELKKQLFYDTETGQFTRLISQSNAVCVGDVAGSPDCKGYLRITVNGRMYLSHRLAFLYVHGDMPPQIDHINGDPSDNRIANLRAATGSQNLANRGPTKRNTSGFKGVCWLKQKKKWKAQIQINRKYIYIGLFSSAEDAYAAYCEIAKRHFGDFAKVG